MSLSLSIPLDKILGRGICAEPGWARRRPEPIGKDWWVRSFCIREIPIGRISTRCSWYKRAQIVAVYRAIYVFSASRRKPLEQSCAFGILPFKKGSFSLQFRPFLRSNMSNWEKKIISSFGFPGRVWILVYPSQRGLLAFLFQVFPFLSKYICLISEVIAQRSKRVWFLLSLFRVWVSQFCQCAKSGHCRYASFFVLDPGTV